MIPSNIEHTTDGNFKRVTFTLDGVDCELVQSAWDMPVRAYADRDGDGVREPTALVTADVRNGCHMAWTHDSDEALLEAQRKVAKALRQMLTS